MRYFAAILAASALATPIPALAQDVGVDPDVAIQQDETEMSEVIDTLSDPQVQQQLTDTVATLSEVLLDMPLAPMANALAQAGVAAADEVPADATIRSMAPGADRLPQEIEENLPRMMGAMAAMAQGMETMLPALREMAEKMKESLPRDLAPEV